MADNKYNLDGIKKEMAARRNERNTVSEQLGESVDVKEAKDGFLNGLLTSYKTGAETSSTKRIKLIENKVDIKEGKQPKFKENNNISHEIAQPKPSNRSVLTEDSFDRDELMYSKLAEKSSRAGQSLSESLMNINSVNNNHNQPVQSTVMNENVKNVVNNYLAENFSLIVEESIKNTILEAYAVERIKNVLQENKGLIKSIMLEILKEMKSKQNP